ncbi:hypothetical protein LZ198_14310 [Myxococcus sp. K15C18031901]|uniref:hypothetical protein n=1 Tax=Myxococcus dinghuensis TaxID=2906761 RepID=UPI0020A795BC|nr:hypothetical protein [Myxococcus dinghuensis]MCP3100046.1 hypothetical protein [Myxococcus dinghuensis]
MTRIGAWVGGILLTGALSYGVYRLLGAADSRARDSEEQAAGLQALESQVRELKAAVAQSTRTAQEAQAAAQAARLSGPRAEPSATAGVGSGGAGATPPGASREDAAAPPREATPDDAVLRLDARFFGESVDPTWRRDAEQRTERLRAELPRGVRIVSMECRSSICRLEMSHPSLESFQKFIRDRLVDDVATWDGPFMAAVKGPAGNAGEVEAVAYLARPGTTLMP